MHRTIEPAILYFGTPVVLVTSENEDGSTNVAPMSSAWWLGWSCMLGFGARSKTPANVLRTGECVLNLPSVDQVHAVDRLARTTGSNPVPPHKVAMGYRYEPDKLGTGGLTAGPPISWRRRGCVSARCSSRRRSRGRTRSPPTSPTAPAS